MPVWVGTIVLPGGSGRVIRFREEIDGVGAWDAKRIIENKYGGKMNCLPNIDTRGREQQSRSHFNITPSSFGTSRIISSPTTGTSDTAAMGAAIEGLGELAALGLKGAWKLGKFGVRKYKENQEAKKYNEEQERYSKFKSILENPRSHIVRWSLPGLKTDLEYDGAVSMTLAYIPEILCRYIDDAIDDLPANSEEENAWKKILSIAEAAQSSLTEDLYGNLAITNAGYELSVPTCAIIDFVGMCAIYRRLLERQSDQLDEELTKSLKRVQKALVTLVQHCESTLSGNDNTGSILKPVFALNYYETLALPDAPLKSIHFGSGEDEDGADEDDNMDEFDDDDDFVIDEELDDHGNRGEYKLGRSGEANAINELSTSGSKSDYSEAYEAYEATLYKKSPKSPSGWWGQEGVFIISKTQLFFMTDEGYESLPNHNALSFINDAPPGLTWSLKISEIVKIYQSREFFRSVVYLERESALYRIIFSVGRSQEVIDRVEYLMSAQ